MRTFLAVLASALTIPVAIMNWGAVIVGGIWLAILGQWSLLILGLFLIFAGTFPLSLAMAPGLGLGFVAAKVFEKSKVASYPLFAVVALYNFLVLCAWCVGLFYFCELREHGPYWPFILWAYPLATIPWVSAYTEEAKSGDAEGSLAWVAGAEFGSLAIIVSVVVGYGFQTLFGMVVFFVPVALFAMGMTAFLSHYKRKRIDRIFKKVQREAGADKGVGMKSLLLRIRARLPEPTVKFAAIVVVLLFGLNGAFGATRHIPNDAWYVQAAYVFGAFFGAAAKGAIIAVLTWLVSLGGEKLRLKKRHDVPFWIGTVLYWLGYAGGLYVLCLSIYLVLHAFGTGDNTPGMPGAIFFMTFTAFFYWFLGGGIRFMLDGHAANGSAATTQPQET